MSENRLPGVGSDRSSGYRSILATLIGVLYLTAGKIIDGSKARDPLNTGDVDVLRPGMLMGKITTGGKYAPSVLGVTTSAYADDETELDVSVATATEIVRRIGTSGDLKLIGPPSAAGTVATKTVSFTAVDTATGVITVPDLGADFVVGSLVCPADGSETPKAILNKEDGLKVTDEDGTSIDVAGAELLIGGQIDASQIINYPADASLKAWVKAQLRAVGGAYTFDDDF